MTDKRIFLFCMAAGGVLLAITSIAWWRFGGSIVAVGTLIIGLILFLEVIIYTLRRDSLVIRWRRHWKQLVFILLLGSFTGIIFFDLPVTFVFKAWQYPVSALLYVLFYIPGWGGFFLLFYESYVLFHLALRREYQGFGVHTNTERPSDYVFSLIGLGGIVLFILAVCLAAIGIERVFAATIAALGIWFILENIEFQKTKRTLLTDLLRGDVRPLLAIAVGSVVLSFIFEFINSVAPKHYWLYQVFLGLPFKLMESQCSFCYHGRGCISFFYHCTKFFTAETAICGSSNMREKFSTIREWAVFYKKELVFAAIIFLVASLNFGLGYLANREFNHAPIIIEKGAFAE